MKRLLLVGVAAVLLLASCASPPPLIRDTEPPSVAPPRDEASSLLAVELIAYTSGQRGTEGSRKVLNQPESGFYPVVLGPGGEEVRFYNHDHDPDSGMIYYRENLSPGVYTLIGFRYQWVRMYDLQRLPAHQRYFDGQRRQPWQQSTMLNLPRPVPLYLRPGSVDSLGRHVISYELEKQGDHYYALSTWRYRRSSPGDTHVLQVIKNWYAGAWPMWNARNPAGALRR